MIVLRLLNCLHSVLEFAQTHFIILQASSLPYAFLFYKKKHQSILINVYGHVTLNVGTIVIVNMNYIIIIW